MQFVVLGAGMMGRAVVCGLAKAAGVERLVVADFDRAKAEALAREFGRKKIHAAFADARDTRGLARLLRGADAVVNCAQYTWNLDVMKAALAARVHYLDLGGLYYMTRRQFRMDADFRRAGLLAIAGMGGAPGITNVMARAASEKMERVESIGVYNASTDEQRYASPLAWTFSIATILDELTTPPVTFDRGRFVKRPLFSEPVRQVFRAPIGPVVLRNSLHSELGTLPVTFRSRGVRDVRFKINYEPEFVSFVRGLAEAGLTSDRAVAVNGARISPRAMLLALLSRRAPEKPPRDTEAMRVVITGIAGGRPSTVVMEAWTKYWTRPPLSAVARDTGFPAAIAALLLARGEIRGTGVHAPEEVVPPEPFFRELERREIFLRRWTIKRPGKTGRRRQ